MSKIKKKRSQIILKQEKQISEIWETYTPVFAYEQSYFDIYWPWAGHKHFAYDLVRNLKPQTVVELGTHYGTSIFSMAQAVKDVDLHTALYAVDTWTGDKHTGAYDDSVYQAVNTMKYAYYPKVNINFLKMTFDEALDQFENSSIDLLHIDGLHTYDAVKHDYDSWKIKVKDTGIIMFHDICEHIKDFGVYKLWEELKKEYCTFEFFHSHGLGVVCYSKEIYNSLKNYETLWQSYYSLINKYIQTKYTLDQKLDEIARIQSNSEVKVENIKSLELKLNELLQENGQLKETINSFNNTVKTE
ncbi:MAG TPA: class I SAM-dependent methyltransferase [Candidatus Nitrosocosmicus sp.]|nr:class I SAM-dependent methyltransferase [Candidatus Nitrosocosmicus sp.]